MYKITILVFSLFLIKLLFATNYYVANNGSNTNSGLSVDVPFLTIDKAASMVQAGDTIFIRGGIHAYSATLSISKSGNSTKRIYMFAYANERPILDFAATAFGKKGMSLTGSYWHIYGLDFKNAGDNGLYIGTGGNNVIELCNFYDNKDSGLQLSGKTNNNKIINCDSYYNADPTDYGDADGFAVKMDVGTNNYFYGCRAWLNVDDGWDGYMRGNDDVSTVLENCWTWRNGYFKNGTDAGAAANGNGFKMGGSDDKTLKHNFTLINCLVFDNKAKGFDQNNNKGTMIVHNGTSFRNKGNNYSIPSTLASGKKAEVYNCVNFNGGISLGSFVVQNVNSWDEIYTITAADFMSTDTSGVSGPRKEDGSLPDLPFMKLAAGSDLIDAGKDLGHPYFGIKPDLGAFEFRTNTGDSQINANSRSLSQKFTAYYSSLQNELVIVPQCNFSSKYELHLYTLDGKCIAKSSNINFDDNSGLFNLSNLTLAKGIYLIHLHSNEENMMLRFRVINQ